MKLIATLGVMSALLVTQALSAATTAAPKAHAVSTTAAVAAPMAVTPTETTAMEPAAATVSAPRFALGVGYPDLRLRYDMNDWALEAKGSFNEGLQVYSGRLSYDFVTLGPLKALAGTEAGWIKFDGLETMSGTGSYGQLFLGLEYPFANRFKLEVDGGPLYVQLASEGQSVGQTDLVVDAAFYLYLW